MQVSPTDNLSETSWAKSPYSISEYGHNTEKYITPAQQNIEKTIKGIVQYYSTVFRP